MTRRWLALAAAAVAFSAACSTYAAAAADREIDYATHNRIEIRAPASAVWARLFALPTWKASVVETRAVSGAHGAIGEVTAVFLRGGGAEPAYFLRTVEIVPGRRIVWRLFNPADPALAVFVAATLTARDGVTRMTWDVFATVAALADASLPITELRQQRLQQATRQRRKISTTSGAGR